METMQKQMSDQQRLFDEQRSLHSTVVDDYQHRLDMLAIDSKRQWRVAPARSHIQSRAGSDQDRYALVMAVLARNN